MAENADCATCGKEIRPSHDATVVNERLLVHDRPACDPTDGYKTLDQFY